MGVDPAGRHLRRHLRHASVVEDEQLVAAAVLPCHVRHYALADERVEERAMGRPERQVGANRLPAHRDAFVLPLLRGLDRGLGVQELALMQEARLEPAGLLGVADFAHDRDPFEACLLLYLSGSRLLRCLARLDSACRAVQARELRVLEDQELIGSGERMFARDVDDDAWPAHARHARRGARRSARRLQPWSGSCSRGGWSA
jgi:hypothetical protein